MAAAGQVRTGCLCAAVIGAVVVAVLVVTLVEVLRSGRDLQWAGVATTELTERAARLEKLELETLPGDGVYGADGLPRTLSELLTPRGPLSFRLEVRRGEGTAVDFARFRLTCTWLSGSSDVVVFRGKSTCSFGGLGP